jgi:hypothetical protein
MKVIRNAQNSLNKKLQHYPESQLSEVMNSKSQMISSESIVDTIQIKWAEVPPHCRTIAVS